MAEHAPKLNLAQTLNLSQQLKLMLNPRMLQLLKTLHLPYPDLLESINKEAAENPALEISRQDELLNYARTLSRGGERSLSGYDDSRPDKELKARGPTLREHLLQQARLEDFDEADLRVAEQLIDAIDERGYIEDYKAVREQIVTAGGATKNRVDHVLETIQTFEPDGVGARSLKECLLIQIREYNFENEALQQVISDAVKYHLDNLAKKNFAAIAEDLDIEPEGAKFIADFIEKNLNPLPGNAFKTDDNVQTIIPSFIIKHAESGGFTVLNLEADKGPRLNISNQYLQMLDDPAADAKTKEYLRERLAAAKIFIENIEKRYQTTQNIVDIIVKTQADFLENGYYWLKPLQQDALAQNVGVHPSTISRAVSTKYAETPQGLYPLKYLCPRNFKGYTAMQIKGMLIKIIREQPQLSDQKIAKLLNEQRGIPIKRRTIAKYRTDLGEASSYGRKK
ncbi:RNA polymerase sigma-54 factor [Candidatus Termititenax aidoneus]|uniref:RNA polymerase sigma-54 factor n=1 Tax=Termititenax aidoneus TaxID=2218524 RepID=A0A388TDF6_TERA1|nr:RNA polymerase sigma-54 factor [Candidatus Termititenax aidoneus]